MTGFTLYCLGDGFKQGIWSFTPVNDGMNVADPDGEVLCWVPHHSAGDRFILPSFWGSVKHIGFVTPAGSTVSFNPDRRDVARVREYLDEAVAAQGVEAVHKLWKLGWINVACGLALIFAAWLAIVFFFKILGVENRHGGAAFAAMLLGGIGETAWGVGALSRAARVQKKLRNASNEEHEAAGST